MGKTIKKAYTKSKAFDTSCRCHGGCPYCEENRAHQHKKQPKLNNLLKEYYEIESNEPTKKQEETVEHFYKNGGWKCPSCKSETGSSPSIENPGEELTQIYCHYGCEYIFLDDYIK